MILHALLLTVLLTVPAMGDALDRAAERIRLWRHEPITFVRENFKVEPDAWQRQALTEFAKTDERSRRLAMQACAGPGKSAVLAWCGWNFLTCYANKGEHPNGYAISITGDNLRDNLWKELAVWRDRSDFLTAAFEWTAEKIFAREHPADWWIRARTYPKSADPEAQGRTLSGLHARYILYLIDESGDIGVPILRAAEQGLGNCAWGKILQAGNPTSHTGILYLAASAQSHRWTVIRITGDPDDPNRSPRIPVEWAQEQIATYGRDNPWVMAYVLGLFPPSSINALLGPDEVYEAMKRHLREPQYASMQKRLGVDVARFGDDRTVLFPRQGLATFPPVILRQQDTVKIAGRVMMAVERWGAEVIMIDDTGHWGHGVYDNLNAAGVPAFPIQFHAHAIDEQRYKNRRTEMWLKMAEWVKGGGALPNLPELVGELTTPTYTFVNGRFVLEDKDQIKKLLGRSPDLADALALTFALPDMPSQAHLPPALRGQPGRAMPYDYDPLADRHENRNAMADYDPLAEV